MRFTGRRDTLQYLRADDIAIRIVRVTEKYRGAGWCRFNGPDETEAINKIEGASAKVDLKKEEAVVSYDREINDDDLKKAVEEAGFKVVDIRA